MTTHATVIEVHDLNDKGTFMPIVKDEENLYYFSDCYTRMENDLYEQFPSRFEIFKNKFVKGPRYWLEPLNNWYNGHKYT